MKKTFTHAITVLFFLMLSVLPTKLLAQACNCTNCPVDLPDVLATPFAGQLSVQGATNNNLSTNPLQQVCVNITHDWIGDLDITLTSPNGTQVVLFGDGNNDTSLSGTETSPFGNLGDDMVVCFVLPTASGIVGDFSVSNAGTGDICNGGQSAYVACNGTVPCYTGNWLPYDQNCNGPDAGLAAFSTGTVNGTWTLTINDNAGANQGTLNDFYLVFANNTGIDCASVTPSCPATAGTTDVTPPLINTCAGVNVPVSTAGSSLASLGNNACIVWGFWVQSDPLGVFPGLPGIGTAPSGGLPNNDPNFVGYWDTPASAIGPNATMPAEDNGVTYYVAPITMQNCNNGNIDPDCFDVGAPVQIYYNPPIDFSYVISCQSVPSQLAQMVITIEGGHPSAGSGSFTLTDNGAGSLSTLTVANGGTVTVSGIPDNGTVNITVTDNLGCTQSIVVGPIDVTTYCPTCSVNAGNVSSTQTGNGDTDINNGTNSNGPFVLCWGDQLALDQIAGTGIAPPPAPCGPPSVDCFGSGFVYTLYADQPFSADPFDPTNSTGWGTVNNYNNGTLTIVNDGSDYPFFSATSEATNPIQNNTLWYVITTADYLYCPTGCSYSYDANNDNCYDQGVPIEVVFLNPIEASVISTCDGVKIELHGGYPEFFAGNYALSNTGNGTLSTPFVAPNQPFEITGLTNGQTYNITVTDANGCPKTITGTYNFTQPVVNFSGLTSPICAGAAPINLTGNPLPSTTAAVGPTTFTGVGGAIPDGTGASFTSNATVTGFPYQLNSVNNITVTLTFGTGNNTEHTWAGDIVATLTSPCGTSVTLLNQIGLNATYINGTDADLNGAYTFSASAASTPPPSYGGNNIATGTYLPNESFTDFLNCTLNGTWTLTLTDVGSSDDGNLTNWSINLSAPAYNNTVSFSGPGITNNLTSGNPNGTAVFNPATAGSGTHDITYSYTYGPGGVCTKDVTQTVVVNPFPSVDATGKTICSGQSTNLTLNNNLGVAGVTYTWTVSSVTGGVTGASASSGGTINQTLIYTGATQGTVTYSVVATSPAPASCPGPPLLVTVTVNPSPSAGTGSNQNACNTAGGSNIDLFALLSGEAAGGTWTASAGNPSGGTFTAASGTFNPSAASVGIHTFTYTVGTSPCQDTENVTVTVSTITAPTITGNTTVCSGGSISLDAGAGYSTYAWSNSGGSGQTSTFNNITTNTTYTVTVTGAGGCTASDTHQVTVTAIPTVTDPADQTLCAGATTTAVNFTGTGSPTFNWTNNTPSIGLAASGSGNIGAFTVTNATTLPVTATITVTPTVAGCPGTAQTFTITVNPLPTVTDPTDQTVCAGTSTAAVNFSGTAGATYNWTNNTPSIGLAASGTSNIGSFTATNATASPVTATITVTPTVAGCPGTAQTFTITVNPLPTVTDPADQIVCEGASVTIPAFSGSAGASFSWTNSNTAIGLGASGSGGISSFTATNTGSTPITATITVTPTAGTSPTCTGTPQTFTITVNASNPVALTPLSAICANASAITLNTTQGGIAGTWSGSGVTGNSFNPSGLSGPITLTFTPNGTQCADVTTTTITVNDTPSASISGSSTFCAGGNTTLSAPAGMTTYAWTASGGGNIPAGTSGNPSITVNTAGTYTVSITDGNGCSSSTSITVTQQSALNPNITGGGVICADAVPATLDAGSGFASYTWGAGAGGTISGGTGSQTASATTTGTYTVTVTQGACSGTGTTTLTVNPVPTVTAPANQSFCHNVTTTAINITGTAGATFDWTNNNVSIGLAASGAGTIPAFTADNTGTSPVVATITITPTLNGCSGTPQSFTITINPLPTVTDPSNQTICAGTNTSTVAFSGTTGATYAWTNNTTSIGLAASGTGNIGTFSATNAGTTPVTATITVTPTLATCPGTPQSFDITVNPLPTVTDPADQILCAGSNTSAITFSGTTGATFDWTNSTPSIGLAASGTGNIGAFAATNTGTSPVTTTITVTPSIGSSPTCVGTPQTFTITANPLPTVTVPATQTLCNNVSAAIPAFSGTTGATFSWSNSNTAIGLAASGTGNIGSFTPTNTGTSPISATITVTPSIGSSPACAGTPQTFTITVNPSPTVNPVSPQTLCAGQSVSAVTFNGSAGATFNWTNSNTAIGLAANGSGDISAFTATNATASPITATITVTPTLAGCSGSPQTFTITVNPLVTPTLSVSPTTLCAIDAPINLNTTQSGITGSWSGTGVTGGNTFNPSGLSGPITLTFNSNPGQCANNNTTIINVNAPTVVPLTSPSPLCSIDNSVTLNTTQSGITGSWSGTGVTGGNTFNPSGLSGPITLTFTPDAGQCRLANTTTINVTLANTINIPPFSTVCSLDPAVSLGTTQGGFSGTWSGTGVSGNSFNPSGQSGSITLQFAPNTGQCALPSVTTISVNPASAAAPASPGDQCTNGSSITLTTNQGGLTGTWSGSGVTGGNTFNPSGLSGIITLTFTPTVGQCATAGTTTLVVNAPVNAGNNGTVSLCSTAAPINLFNSLGGTPQAGGTWTDASGTPTSNTFDPATQAGGVFTYTVPGTSGCPSASATVGVTVNTTTPPTINGGGAICNGGNISLSVTGTYSNYSWSGGGGTNAGANYNNVSTPTTYTVTVTGTGGCIATASTNVTINALPTPTITGGNPTCSGSNITLSTSTPYSSYTWSNSGGSSSTANYNNVTATTSYTVTVTDGNGCQGIGTTNVTVNALPTLAVASNCGGGLNTGSINSTATAGVSGSLSYTINGTTDTDGDANNLANNSYTVVVTETPSGCSTTETVSVNCNCPTITVAGSASLCQTATATTYTQAGGNAGGVWTINPTTAGTINSSTGSFAPNVSYDGTVSIIYTAAGCNGNLDVAITPQITPTFNPLANVCQNATAPTLPTTSINSITGTWSPAVSTATATTTIYTFTPAANQCATNTTATLTVDALPTPTINGGGAICSGGDVNLSTTQSYNTYNWSNSGGSSSTANYNNVTATTSYTVTVTDGNGCQGTGTTNVTVNALPTLSVTTACGGGIDTGSINSTANPGAGGTLTYTINGTTITGGDMTDLPNNSYTVVVTETPSGCSTTETVSVNCNCPTITVAGSASLCQTATATTYTQAGGNAGGVWTINPTTAGTINSSTGSFAPNVSYDGNVSIIYTAAGCNGNLDVAITPQITPTFNPLANVCQNATAPTLPTTSINSITGTWSPAVSTATATTTTYTFTPAANQCATNTTATLTVDALPTPTINGGGAICSGGDVNLSTTQSYNTYNWSNSGGSSSTANYNNVTATTSYTVTVTDSNGCQGTGTTNVTVNALPTLAVTTACGGGIDTGSINSTANPGAGGTLSYTINGTTDIDGNANNLANNSYTVVVTETPSGCSTTETVSVNCNCPTITVTGSATLCQTAPATNYAQAGGNAGGVWTINPTTAGTINSSTGSFAPNASYDGTVSIIYTAAGCNGNLDVAITPQITPTFNPLANVCQNAAAPTLPTTSINSITGTWSPAVSTATTTTTIYTFTPAANQCATNTTATLTVDALPTPTINSVGAICSGGDVNLSTTQSYNTYNWSNSGGSSSTANYNNVTATTSYTVTVTDGNGCQNSTTVTVTVNNATPPTIAAQTVCSGNNVSFDAGAGYTNYNWSDGGGSNQIATYTNITSIGTYTVTVTDNNGCTSTALANVTVNNATPPTIAAQTVCSGNNVSFDAGTGYTNYNWSNGGGSNQIATYTNITSVSTYTVTVTATGGCTATGTASVSLSPPPTASIASGNICEGNSLTLTASGGSSYNWSGNGVTTAAANPQIINGLTPSTSTYNVTVTGGNGCTGTASTTITVNANPNPSISGSSTFCTGTSTTLTANGGGTYAWTASNGGAISGAANTASITVNTTGTYTVVVTNNGCTGTASIAVTQATSLSPNITGNTQICPGSTTTLNAGSGFSSYLWSASAGNAVTQSVNNIGVGTYSVTVSDASGCTGSTVTNVIQLNPTATATNTGAVCQGGTVNLNASVGTAYSWSGPAGYSSNVQNPVINIPNNAPANSYTYTVTVTDNNTCTATASTTVVVNALPTASISGNTSICSGDASSISFTGTPNAIVTYTVNGGSNQTVTLTGGTATVSTGALTATATYTLVSVVSAAPASCSTAASGSAVVTVNPLPTASISGSTSFCSGGSANLSFTGTPNAIVSYTINGGSNQTATLNAAGTATVSTGSLTTTATYTLVSVVSATPASCPNTASGSAVISVDALPNASAGGGGNVCSASTINLSASGGTSYNWSGSGITASTQNQQNPVIASATVGMSGTYVVTVTDVNGCTATASTTVTVAPCACPNPPTVSGLSSVDVCAGTTTNLSVTLGGGATTATWTTSGSGSFSATTGTSVTYTPSAADIAAGSVTITITTDDPDGAALECSVATTTTTVSINALPTAAISGTNTICAGDNTTLTASGGNAYSWTLPNGGGTSSANPLNINNATNANGGVYTVTVTNANNCTAVANTTVTVNALPTATAGGATVCVGDAINLTSSGGTTYSWSGSGITASTQDQQNPSIAAATAGMAGIYTVTVTGNNTCTTTASTTVIVNANPVAGINGISSFCEGGSTTLTATGGTAYTWSGAGISNPNQAQQIIGGLTAGSYSYAVTVSNGNCSATATTDVTVNAAPVPQITGSATFCFGGSSTLDAGSGYTTYLWTPGNFATQSITVTSSGTYTVEVTNAAGCTGTAQIVVTAAASLTPSISTNSPICAGENATLDAGNSFTTYAWSQGGNSPTITATPATTTTYTVTVTQAGCSGTATAQVIVNPIPTATITGNTPICADGSVALTANGGGIYLWNGAFGSNANITDSPAATTTYTVTVTNNGCSSTASTSVAVNPLPVATANVNSNICEGTSINLTASGGTSYNWSGSGITASTQNQQNPVIAGATVGMSGTYSVTVTDGNTCSSVASVTATVAVCSCPNPATVTAASAAICSGATANLTATIGGGATTATWTTSGSGTFNPSTGISTVYTPSAADIAAGSVTITITTDDPDGNNTQCSAASTTLVLTITNGIVPTFAAIAAICSGDVAPILPTSSLNGISGTWSPALVSNTASGTYTFTPSAGSCASTATVNVTVNASPQISVSDNCTGATADVTVTIVSGTPTAYSLDNGTAQAGTAFAGVANGNHTIVATDANGCSDSEAFATNCIPGCPTITATGSQSVCAGATAVYTQTGGVAGGVWSVVPAAAGSIDSGGNFASSGVFAGNATITYTDNSTGLGCAGSIVVVVNAITTPTFTAIAPICSGDLSPILPTTSSNGITGTWLPAAVSNTASGTYTFTPSVGSCASTATVNVTVNPQTTPTFAPIAAICSGDVAPVLPAVSIEGIAGSWLPAVVSNTASGTYTFTPAAGACASTATVNVTVNPQTTPTFTAIAPICSGDVAPVLPTTSSNGISGTWLPALVSNTASGSYAFTPAVGACASTATINVTVNASPQISLSDNCTGATADVTVTIVNGNPTNFTLDGTVGTSPFVGVANGNHTIVATDANGCSDSEAFATNCVPGCPTITVTGSQSVCAGATAVYTQAGGVAGGVWSVVPAAAGSIDSGGNFASSGVFAGNATITYTDNSTGLGCAGSIVVAVDAASVPTFAAIAPICSGDVAPVLPAVSIEGIAVTWLPAVVSNTASGTYTFTPSAGSCASTATVNVTVNPQTTPTFAAIAPICSGDVAPVLPTTSSNGISGTWLPALVNNTTSGTYTFTPAAGTCASTATVDVTVNPQTTPTFAAIAPICSGDIAPVLPATSTNGISGTWSPALVSNTASGTYTFTPNAGSCASTASVNVTVNASPQISVSDNCTGATADVTVTIVSGTPTTYSLDSGTSQAGTTFAGVANGNHTIVATDANGCSDSEAFVTNCIPGCPTITVTGSQSVCAGATAVYTQTGGVAGGVWSVVPAAAGSIDSGGNFASSGAFAGNATITYTDNSTGLGCAGSIVVAVDAASVPTFAAIAPICSGDVAPVLAATSTNGISGTWLPALVSNTASGTYTFTPSAGSCASTATVNVTVNSLPIASIVGDVDYCIDDVASLTASGGDSYVWSNASNIETITPSTLVAGTTAYTVTVTDNGCSNTTSITVTVSDCVVDLCPTIVVALDTVLALCDGKDPYWDGWEDFIQFNGSSNTFAGFDWYSDAAMTIPVTPADYTYSGDNCEEQQVDVYVGALCTLNPNPIAAGVLHLILYPPFDTTYLQISNTECSVPVLTSTCPNYLISAENVPTTINPGDSGTATWTVSYNGSGGVQACFVEPFAVNYACPALDCPIAAFTAPTSVCLGDDATLTFTGTASPTASYTWTIGSQTLTGVGPHIVTFNTNGMVEVLLSVTDNGCTDTISHAIMVSSVGVSLVAANISVLLGETTTLTATATSVPPSNITYTWSPSGLSCVDAVCSGVLVTPTQNAVYSVTATNEYGCVANDDVNINVSVKKGIIVPNAFSPNGDGTNDTFQPLITSGTPKTFALFVYDRWGNCVYETTDIANGWDGTYKGFNCEVGVYVYYVAVTYMDDNDEIIKGNVSLVK